MGQGNPHSDHKADLKHGDIGVIISSRLLKTPNLADVLHTHFNKDGATRALGSSEFYIGQGMGQKGLSMIVVGAGSVTADQIDAAFVGKTTVPVHFNIVANPQTGDYHFRRRPRKSLTVFEGKPEINERAPNIA